jgi:hypothetical protein
LLNQDEKSRIKSKDIFLHPWVKGFEFEKVTNLEEPEKTIQKMNTQKTLASIKITKPNILRTSESKKSEEQKTNKNVSNTTGFKAQLSEKKFNSKTPIRSNYNTTNPKSEAATISFKKLETNIKEINDSGNKESQNEKINEMKKKINHTKQKSIIDIQSNPLLNEFTLLGGPTTNAKAESNLFTNVLNKVVKKNDKGVKQIPRGPVPNITGLGKQNEILKTSNKSINESSILDFSLILGRTEIDQKLQDQHCEILLKQAKTLEAKNDMSVLDSIRSEYRPDQDIEDEDEYRLIKVDNLKKDFVPKIINVNNSPKISTAANTQKPSIISSNGYYNDELFLDNHTRSNTRKNSATAKRASYMGNKEKIMKDVKEVVNK